MTLDPWPFVIAAYAVAIGGTLVLAVHSFVTMRRAERQAETLTRR